MHFSKNNLKNLISKLIQNLTQIQIFQPFCDPKTDKPGPRYASGGENHLCLATRANSNWDEKRRGKFRCIRGWEKKATAPEAVPSKQQHQNSFQFERERIRGRRRAKSEREKLREWVTRCGVESDVSFPPNGGCLLSDGGNFAMGKCWRERERSEGESLCREREQCHLVLSIESRKFNANWSMDGDLVWRGNQLEDVLFSYWYFL